MRRNGCPKETVRFILRPLIRFALKTPENLKGAEKERTLQKNLLDNRFSARRLFWGVAEGSSISWVAIFKGAKNSE